MRPLAWMVCAASWCLAGCMPRTDPAEAPNEADLPAEVRADYEVFAQRCSKCHSLARPLMSGITDDEVWKYYVERMRRQAGSGISPRDTEPILRFLHYHSQEVKHRRGGE